MSALAKALPKAAEILEDRAKPGPRGACAVYGPGDQEDWLVVDALRRDKSWKIARAKVHVELGISGNIPDHNKFRYHWRGKCSCWTDDLKAWIEDQS